MYVLSKSDELNWMIIWIKVAKQFKGVSSFLYILTFCVYHPQTENKAD